MSHRKIGWDHGSCHRAPWWDSVCNPIREHVLNVEWGLDQNRKAASKKASLECDGVVKEGIAIWPWGEHLFLRSLVNDGCVERWAGHIRRHFARRLQISHIHILLQCFACSDSNSCRFNRLSGNYATAHDDKTTKKVISYIMLQKLSQLRKGEKRWLSPKK